MTILNQAEVAAIQKRARRVVIHPRDNGYQIIILDVPRLCDTIEALRERVAELELCECGRPLSVGLCNVCDNDE